MNQEQHAKLYPGAGQLLEAMAESSEIGKRYTDVQSVTAASILQSGLDAMLKNAALRDKPTGERSAPKAAAILTAWTDEEWTAIDVWRVLVAVKLARESQGAVHLDDYVDSAAYLALLGEQTAELNR